MKASPSASRVELADLRVLAEFRYQIRRFVAWSERECRRFGHEPQHYQAMVALAGLPDGMRSTVGVLAERLQLRHNSVVELVDRMVERGLVERKDSDGDGREVILALTARGTRAMRPLADRHWKQLGSVGPELVRSLRAAVREST